MGKSPSKLNGLDQKRRSQSIAWSFRFGSSKKKMMPILLTNPTGTTSSTPYPHLDIKIWLIRLDLELYLDRFKRFNGVEDIIEYSEVELKALGIRSAAHRARMFSSLVVLRDKHKRKDSVVRRQHSLREQKHLSLPLEQNQLIPSAESSIYEALANKENSEIIRTTTTKQSKSLGDLCEMDTIPGEDALALKKALDWELSLDSRDLRSHAWYHGPIPRTRAEDIVKKDGDFLIRDCVSQPGNFVLTCKTKGPVLHFVINKILIQPETVYERIQYQFEDDAYDTVPDLITFYVGSGRPISLASGAKIQYPCNRSYPLSFYATKYIQHHPANLQRNSSSPLNSPSIINAGFSPMSSPPRTKREIPPRLPSKKYRSHSLTQNHQHGSQQIGSDYPINNSADGIIHGASNDTIDFSQIKSDDSRRLLLVTERCNSADGIMKNQINAGGEKSTSADGVIINSNNQRLQQQHNYSQYLQQQQQQQQHQHRQHHTLNHSLSFRSSIGDQNTNNIDPRTRFSTQSLNRMNNFQNIKRIPSTNFSRDSTSDDQQLNNENIAPSPPPKPNRSGSIKKPPPPPSSSSSSSAALDNQSIKDLQLDNNIPVAIGNRVPSYHASGSDSGNGSGDSQQSSAPGDTNSSDSLSGQRNNNCPGVIIKNPRFLPNSASSVTLRSFGDFDVIAAEEQLFTMPEITIAPAIKSKFDIENFQTVLLPSIENKPLDNEALNTLRMMLNETGPRVIANHLTRIDIELLLGIENRTDTDEQQQQQQKQQLQQQQYESLKKITGIELVALPHGTVFRKDLIERTECIRLLVAITILTCQSDVERADTLHKWIQVAIDTKTALGNLFGFCAIMLGLCMPQIQKLDTTWHRLRQIYTDSAFCFEAKLKPTLKNMNDCTNPQAPNTTVPHLLPYILLRDRGIEDILGLNQPNSTLMQGCVTSWETNTADFGLSILFSHLDSIRHFIKSLPTYQRNAQIVIEDSNSRHDELLEDAFRTEFHLKFLWGSKGAQSASAFDRHTKLEQVLTLMAERFCCVDAVN